MLFREEISTGIPDVELSGVIDPFSCNSMRTRAKRELFVGLQYLLIGIVAEIAVLRWFRRDDLDLATQIAAWCLVAIVLGLLRIIIIVLASQVRRDQWQSISRRNWI